VLQHELVRLLQAPADQRRQARLARYRRLGPATRATGGLSES
jgi:hypothetical protein